MCSLLQIFQTLPDAPLSEPISGSVSPPNAPPRQSRRQGQRNKRPVAVYNLCLELDDSKMLIIFSILAAEWSRSISCVIRAAYSSFPFHYFDYLFFFKLENGARREGRVHSYDIVLYISGTKGEPVPFNTVALFFKPNLCNL